MTPQDLEQVKKDIELGRNLHGLKNHSGYKEMINYFLGQYQEAFRSLRQRDDPEARIKLNVIEGFMKWFDDSINFSEDLVKKYKTRLFGQN